ncbi:MAG TPA: acetate--CoA ligase family protein [Streptosporangiaceae bacterium]|jgi:acyl-CoA synthetase (NDP forming)
MNTAMLEARSVALVGASARPGTFGQRMIDEVTRSPAAPRVHLVNPRYREIGGRICHPSLADLPELVDLVLLAVPDDALEEQLSVAARRGDASAVIFGNAHEEPHCAGAGDRLASSRPAQPADRAVDRSGGGPPLRARLAAIARSAGMQLCGAGCMGFVNVSYGLRAIGYAEPDPLPAGPVALVTHSGSVFSAMLRTRRAIGFTVAVSSGQELVTAAPAYLDYALSLPQTRVLALVLEAMRQPAELRRVLATAAARDLPVVLLSTGASAAGRVLVEAHSGALAASDGGWEALARRYGVHRVHDLAELADTLELFAIGRPAARARPASTAAQPRPTSRAAQPRPASTAAVPRSASPPGGQAGIATVHDSGLERAHAADLAESLGVRYAQLSDATTTRLASLLDPGLAPGNPLDVWGTGAATRELFAASLTALADDPSVAAVALAVDLVHELDGDESYPEAVLDAAAATGKPVAVLSNLASAVDPELAARLRERGIPVLEGMRTGLLALRHLIEHGSASPAAAGDRPAGPRGGAGQADPERSAHARRLLADGSASGAPLLDLLREYGIHAARARAASDEPGVLAAAAAIGYPVVLKTGEPAVAHKSDAGGVVLGIAEPASLSAAYRDLADRLGPRALVCQMVPPGTELALGIARDPDLGPLIVIGAGGILVELLADRVVALPPVDEQLAARLLAELRVSKLLAGARGAQPADHGAIVRAITGLSALACDLADELEALDINPLICGPGGATAVDALAIPRQAAR